MDTISNIPTETTVTLSPLETMRARIRDAEREFSRILRTEFKAMHDRTSELYDEISEARDERHFDRDGRLPKLLNKALKSLDEVVQTLSDGTDEDA
jgi:hypothetical protein